MSLSSARKTAPRALWGTDEFLDRAGGCGRESFRALRPASRAVDGDSLPQRRARGPSRALPHDGVHICPESRFGMGPAHVPLRFIGANQILLCCRIAEKCNATAVVLHSFKSPSSLGDADQLREDQDGCSSPLPRSQVLEAALRS